MTALPTKMGGLGNTTGDASGLSVTATGGSTALALRNLVAVDARYFGCKFDGVTDDTSALTRAITYAIQNGCELVLPAGTAIVTNKVGLAGLNITGVKPFRIRGAGRFLTTIKRAGAYTTNAQIEFDNFPLGFELSDFTIDAAYSTYAVNTHGLVVYASSHVRLSRLHVRDYFSTGILVYQDAGGTNVNCVGDDCSVEGLSVANNGLLMVAMIRSGWNNCVALNCPGSPGIGLQLKNNCQYCWIDGGYVENCFNGVGFGQDTSSTAVVNSRVRGTIIKNCQSGFSAGYAYNCDIDISVIDCGDITANGYAVDLQSSVALSIRVGQIKNNAHRGVLCRTGTTDCLIEVGEVYNDQGPGVVCEFQSGSDRNFVRLKKFALPTTITSAASVLVSSGGAANSFIYDPLAPFIPPGTTVVSAQSADNTTVGGSARGAYAVDLQTHRSSANQSAGGNYSGVLWGDSNRASGTVSAAGGDTNVASGLGTVVFSANSLADGSYSSVFGGLYGWTRGTYGKQVYASGRFAAQGDSQLGLHCLRAAVAGASTARATSDGAAAGSANSIPVPAKSAFAERVTVVGFDTATYDCAMWTVDDLLVVRGAGAVQIVGTPTVKKAQATAGAANWSLAISADTTNQCIAFSATGATGANIHLTLDVRGPEAQ